jgi:hypothetical protein
MNDQSQIGEIAGFQRGMHGQHRIVRPHSALAAA